MSSTSTATSGHDREVIRRALSRYGEMRRARDAIILAAHQIGIKPAEIARRTGLSHEWVCKIIAGKTRR